MGKETTNIVSGFLETFVRLSSYQVIDAVLLFVGEDRKNRIDGRKYVFFGWKKKKDSLWVAAKIVQLVLLLWRSSVVVLIDAFKMESE